MGPYGIATLRGVKGMTSGSHMGIALVLWDGAVGGAETFTIALAAELRRQGEDARAVFVGSAGALRGVLEAEKIPFSELHFRRGRDVLFAPRVFRRIVEANGARAAVTIERGFLPTALRLGGYSETIVAVEHGAHLLVPSMTFFPRLKRHTDRAIGAFAADVEVAVSEYMRTTMATSLVRRRVVRIYNGLDLTRFGPAARQSAGECVIGWSGRIVPGKGLECLLAAVARLQDAHEVSVRIAGDGPGRVDLVNLVARLKLGRRVEFLGWVRDVRELWAECDLGAAPATVPESLGMAAIEAMACGRPVVASAIGGLPEVLELGGGTLVPPGDVDALAAAVATYAESREKTVADGAAARVACEQRFDIRVTAAEYVALLDEEGR